MQAAFGDIPVPQAFADIAAKGPTAAPSNMELTQQTDASLKVLAAFESRFETEMKYQNQRLKDLEIKVISERIQALRDRVDDVQVWIDFKDAKNRFTLRGLDPFFNRLAEQKLSAADLGDVFRKSVYQEWINNLYNEDQKLGRFRRENHEQLIADFRKLDQDLIHLTSSMVIEAANSRKPQDILIQAADSEANILLKEAAKKRRLMPIRTLMQKMPNLLVKLKPCLLMSPISVSQFLPPDNKFDLVLFDEASQLVPEDAIGAIYRGKTLVVAGDNKQLPPNLVLPEKPHRQRRLGRTQRRRRGSLRQHPRRVLRHRVTSKNAQVALPQQTRRLNCVLKPPLLRRHHDNFPSCEKPNRQFRRKTSPRTRRHLRPRRRKKQPQRSRKSRRPRL